MLNEYFTSRNDLRSIAAIAKSIEKHYQQIERENIRCSTQLGETPRAWGYWNSSWQQEERNFRSVLPEGFVPLINRTRNRHKSHEGQIVSLTLGSNNSALDGLLDNGRDVQIAMGLQDFRNQETVQSDMRRRFYFIPGTIGTSEAWENLDRLLDSLYKDNIIQEKAANIVIGGMKAGWESIPYSLTNYVYLEEELGKPARRISERSIDLYKNWMFNRVRRICSSVGSTVITDAPAEMHSDLSLWQTQLPPHLKDRVVYSGDGESRSRIKIEDINTI